jgi:hypothetical protein
LTTAVDGGLVVVVVVFTAGVAVVFGVEMLVVVTCVGGLLVVFTEVVEEGAGATVDVVLDELHPMIAGRHSTKIKRTANNFFISSSKNNFPDTFEFNRS